jgi:hypothetical protein
MALVRIGIRGKEEPNMTDVIAAENKALVRRFYEEVYVDWNMALADQVVSPQFTSHDWPEHGSTGPKAFRDYYSAIRSAVPMPGTKSTI